MKQITFVPPIESFKDTRDVIKEVSSKHQNDTANLSLLVSRLSTQVNNITNFQNNNEATSSLNSSTISGPNNQIAVGDGNGGVKFDPLFVWTSTNKLGVGVSTPFINSVAQFHYGTDQNCVIADKAILSDGITIRSISDDFLNGKGLEFRGNPILIGANTGISIGFWGQTPASRQTLNAYTTDPETSAYSGIASGVGGTPYAQLSDLNILRLAYENLRLAYDDLRSKLKTTTLIT